MSPRRRSLGQRPVPVPVLALALALLAAPAVTRAYKVELASGTNVELRWTALPMKFNIHQAAAPGLTAAATQDAVRKAYQTWSSISCSYFKSQDLGVVNLPQGSSNDNVNTHAWLASWPASYGSNALGITMTQYNPQTGKILDADTVYNSSFSWATSGSPSAIDTQSVATHEIGHQLGLDHSNVQSATMFYATGQGDTSQRSLDSDDIAGLCHLYPSGNPPPPECTSPGECAPGELCTNGKCAPGSLKGYGSSCQSGKDCSSGICLDSGGNTFCSQGCDSAACPNGDKCFPVSGGTITKACLPNSANQGTKTLGQVCQTNLDCTSDICVSVPGKGYLCSQDCNVAKNDCTTGFTCASTTAGGGLCIPAATTPNPPNPPLPGKRLGDACGQSSECSSNICADTGAGKVCVQLCDLKSAASCPTGFSCVPAGSDKGACVKSSTKPPPPAPGTLGADCTTSADCASKLCADDGAGKLFCSQLCTLEQGCPDGNFECVAAGENRYACTPRAPPENPASSGGGCVFGAAPRAGGGLLALGVLPLALLALLARRARARRRLSGVRTRAGC